MEERKKSSFTSELFGSKDSSSSGIFGSIFSPSSKVLSRESEGGSKKWDPPSQYSHSKSGSVKENIPGDGSKKIANKDINSYYQEEKVEPCHYSSSIYYGGQDVYSHPKNTQGSTYTSYKQYNKDGIEDDSESASRGNWWQGGLYY